MRGGGSDHPSSASSFKRRNDDFFATLTNVLGDRAVNELRGGFASYYYFRHSIVPNDNHPQAGVTTGTPRIEFTGFRIGQSNINWPQDLGQDIYSLRNDLSYSFTARGRHDLKVGGEYLRLSADTANCRGCGGQIFARGGPVPDNIEELFPVWNDITTWNLAALSPITTSYELSVGTLPTHQRRDTYAVWVQDDWAVTPRLTLNLGVRYDLGLGQFGNDLNIPALGPETGFLLQAGRPDQKNQVGPRVGFAYGVTDRTVLRGGYGLYFSQIGNTPASRTQTWTQLSGVNILNDGRPDFAANPFNGPIPTAEEAQDQFCHNNNVPGCVRLSMLQLVTPDLRVPYSHQFAFGMQQQLGETTAIEMDYVYQGARNEYYNEMFNLTFDPETGVNYPFSDISRRAYPDYAVLGAERHDRRSNQHSLQIGLDKRFSSRWQASGTYRLGGYWDAEANPLSGYAGVGGAVGEEPFPVVPDMGNEYTLAQGDQRHLATLSGIWDVGGGFQMSGLYFYGSGMRLYTRWGGDLRQTGRPGNFWRRLRPDGTVVPRNDFVMPALHRLDTRMQQRIPLGGSAQLDAILEVYNVFNHANFGSFQTNESSRRYGQPNQSSNVAFQPRTLQIGFKATF